MKALVVDDSKAMRMILGRTLRGLGFDVVEAENGEVALSVLAQGGSFSLALVDWNMPVMDGITFVEQARGDRRLDGMSILMVTTETEQSQVLRALSAGANEYLMKPFTPELVAEKLALLGLGRAA